MRNNQHDLKIAKTVRKNTSSFANYLIMMVREHGYAQGHATQLYAAVAPEEPAPQVVSTTDCRSDEGVTVGILDSVITLCRLYKGREITPAVREALRDLAADEDFAKLLKDIQSS